MLVPELGANLRSQPGIHHDHADQYSFGSILSTTPLVKHEVVPITITRISHLSSEGDTDTMFIIVVTIIPNFALFSYFTTDRFHDQLCPYLA